MTKELSQSQIRAIMAKKYNSQWSEKLPFNDETIKMLKNWEGNYELFDKNEKPIYVGSSTEIKHRISSYNELDDPKVHPTKVPLRKEIAFFRFRYIPIHEARIHERNIKDTLGLKFNMDDKKNEMIKREKL